MASAGGAFECVLRELNPERHAGEVGSCEDTRRFLQHEQRRAVEMEQRESERDRELWSDLGGQLD